MPESAHECAASATIDAEPVRKAATRFARATTMFAPSASRTVRRLSEERFEDPMHAHYDRGRSTAQVVNDTGA
ncbi:hypothetical protein ACPPVW_15520 [Leifsonia sp. McL0607]|uniref:hypothetical protein n=1 Tax=Leifsonia sp. McL0607 TaxID=3415672 RepID=UPI003CEA19D1